MKQRLQKILSAAGLCSRRTAEIWLTAGRVSVNGVPASLGDKADPERDSVTVDGKPLRQPEAFRYLMLHKPRGYVTTLSDERGRKTVADLVAGAGVRVYPVGRLDRDSEGLLLLTNDGALAQRLTYPSHAISKTYQVTVQGDTGRAAEHLARVRDLDGEPIAPAKVRTLRQEGDRALLEITLHQGKNRQIRRMCAQCGLTVLRLRRIREDCLTLGGLKSGAWRDLTEDEVAALKGEAPKTHPGGAPGPSRSGRSD